MINILNCILSAIVGMFSYSVAVLMRLICRFQFMTLDEVCGMKDMGEDKAVYSRIKYYCS
ncbi:hypothetical protein CE91St65_42300 [[Clostridium] symbiosum]|nr:hypothetical protein CE91St65_42300 [[Clostridium] symbiosum]BDF31254.1 hypothetical protein CE91St66_42310 [[Clostridium] symbiosum]